MSVLAPPPVLLDLALSASALALLLTMVLVSRVAPRDLGARGRARAADRRGPRLERPDWLVLVLAGVRVP